MVQGHVKTQLIAHDKEVYDIAFSRAGGGRDMFASVGEVAFVSVIVLPFYGDCQAFILLIFAISS